ncbi:hypothetical protein ACFCYB_30330 [Streptomyces sp. NPDC056309]|uniref:hypothetical protein n=1 Tax=unclassified Streptomyces TaxID=2593676 RepID=UPI0035E2D1A9
MLGVSHSGYYRHQATAQSRAERQAKKKRTVSEIRVIHAEYQGLVTPALYGVEVTTIPDAPYSLPGAPAWRPRTLPTTPVWRSV